MPDIFLLKLIALPIAAGLALVFMPERGRAFVKALSVLISFAVFAGTIAIFIKKPVAWEMGGKIFFLADNLSAFIVMAVAFFGVIITVYSCSFVEKWFGKFFGYTLITLGASIAAVLANDMLLLTIFWGVLALLLFLLVNLRETVAASASAKKALIIIGGTDVLMLFGLCLVWSLSNTFALDQVHLQFTNITAYVAYFSLVAAALAKAGAVPFHSWLPDVAESASTNVTAYLPASLDKLLGIYLLARVSLNMFKMNPATNFVLALIGAVTIIFAVVIALVQHDIKKLLGYHAVSQVGYMVLGIGTGSVVGIAGGLFHMLNNAIYKSCLFLTGGAVEKSAGTSDMDSLGGLSKFMPVTFAVCTIAALSISGVPPFNGFVSKWMIYQGIIESAAPKNPWWALWLVAAMFGSALTVASFMKLLHTVFMGRPDARLKNIKEAPLPMLVPMAILALVCVIFGIFAIAIPIGLFICPSISGVVAYCGVWNPTVATILVVLAVGLGALAYLFFRPSKFRTTEIFVGGEDVDKFERITGTEFYNTIKDARILDTLYKKEAEGALDPYNIFKKSVYYFTKVLQKLHNGVLPTYIVWCLIGMICIFAVILFGK